MSIIRWNYGVVLVFVDHLRKWVLFWLVKIFSCYCVSALIKLQIGLKFFCEWIRHHLCSCTWRAAINLSSTSCKSWGIYCTLSNRYWRVNIYQSVVSLSAILVLFIVFHSGKVWLMVSSAVLYTYVFLLSHDSQSLLLHLVRIGSA